MGNHCVETACRICGEEYCLRCHMGICPECGTPWTAEQNEETMDKEEIIEEALTLNKRGKMEVVNRILASLSGAADEKYPVYDALMRFRDVYRELKGIDYGSPKLSPAEFRGMRMLMSKIAGARGGGMKDKTGLVDDVEALMRAVAAMPNGWYFQNRFTPANLAADFEKIYSNIKNNSGHARRKAAFDYL